jgi:hypothetical protein
MQLNQEQGQKTDNCFCGYKTENAEIGLGIETGRIQSNHHSWRSIPETKR